MHWGPIIVFLPQLIISFGNGLLLPGAISGAVSVRPQAAGTAAGITGFAQMALGAAITQYAGTLLAGVADGDAAGVARWYVLVVGAGDFVRAAGAAGARAASPSGALSLRKTTREERHDNEQSHQACVPACARACSACCRPRARAPRRSTELYEKAKAEKEVVFYSGGPAAPHENRVKLFMQQFPGIEVKVTGGFSNVLNEQIEKQMADKKLAVDMAFFQTVQDFVDVEDGRASCSTSSPTASSRSIRTSAIRTAPTCRSAPTR